MKGKKNSERTFRKLPDDGIRGRGATELGEATVANSLNDVRHLRGRGTKKRVLNNVFIFSDPLPFFFGGEILEWSWHFRSRASVGEKKKVCAVLTKGDAPTAP